MYMTKQNIILEAGSAGSAASPELPGTALLPGEACPPSKEGFFKARVLFLRQKRVAFLTVALPVILFGFAVYYTFSRGVPLFFFFLWLAMHFLGMIGISVGFHRLGAHGSFESNSFIRRMFLVLGSMSAQGPVIYWVSNHRRHHHKTDKQGDVHSPYISEDGREFKSKIAGFWQAHTGWMFRSNPSNPVKYAKDLLKDKDALFVNRYYYTWIAAGILVPGLVSLIFFPTLQGFLLGVLFGGFVRLFTVQHVTWLINSFTHMFGKKDFHTNDSSRNAFWLSIPTVGEGWHNNHHAFPYSARLGLQWWQVDMGYYVLYVLKLAGLVRGMRIPSAEEQQMKRNIESESI
jgi:stearoyl-CoA desaturase (delta-9 desaturase)